MFFNAGSILAGLDDLKDKYYIYPSLVTPMPWKEHITPAAPQGVECKIFNDSLIIKWVVQGDYGLSIVYNQEDIDDVKNILRICSFNKGYCRIKTSEAMPKLFLTVVNRVGVESAPIEIIPEKSL